MNPGTRVINLLVSIIIIGILCAIIYIPAMNGAVKFATGKKSVFHRCVGEWHKALTWDIK